MGLWFRKTEPAAAKRDESLPIIRLEGVSKTFKGESDDDTVALDGRLGRHHAGRVRLGLGAVRLRQVDVSVDPRAARDTNVGHVLVERPPNRSADAGRAGARPQPRRRADFSELQPDRRHERVRERRVSADAARQVGAGTRRPGQRRARTGRDDRSRQAAPGSALGRPSAARGDRPRDRRRAADPAGRRADRQPRFEERATR